MTSSITDQSLDSPIDPSWCLHSYRHAISTLSDKTLDGDVATPILWERGALSMRYSPFDWVNTKARVTIVGITPGLVQHRNACRAAKAAIERGLDDNEVLRDAKLAAAFSGPMRLTLVRMLDGINLHRALDLSTSDALFGKAWQLADLTSAICYPVFRNGENYRGKGPQPLKEPILQAFIEHVLAANLRLVPGSLIIPLGKRPRQAVEHLITKGLVQADRCLLGIPHPSGANQGRIKAWYQDGRSAPTAHVKWWFSRR